jgi:hypothetical protein
MIGDTIEALIPTNTISTNIRRKLPTILITSATFVAGLAWNEAIRELIDYYVPDDYKYANNAMYKILYASVVTIIIIIIISVLIQFEKDD